MAQSTTLDEVKRTAWAACDTFRGVLDASEYKDFILVFLFSKQLFGFRWLAFAKR